MVKLCAYIPEDRWSVLEEEGRLVLIRPGYPDAIVDEDTLERLVTVAGYQACTREFAGREEALTFLEAESIRVAGPLRPIEDLRRDLLAVMTPEDLDRQIARAEKKCAEGQHDGARALIRNLFQARAITPDQRATLERMQQGLPDSV
jgi:hypothetical protein